MVRSRITAILVAIAAIFASVAVAAPAANAATLGTSCSAWNVNVLSGISTRTCATVAQLGSYHTFYNRFEARNAHSKGVTLRLTQKAGEGVSTLSVTGSLYVPGHGTAYKTVHGLSMSKTSRAYATSDASYLAVLPFVSHTTVTRY